MELPCIRPPGPAVSRQHAESAARAREPSAPPPPAWFACAPGVVVRTRSRAGAAGAAAVGASGADVTEARLLVVIGRAQATANKHHVHVRDVQDSYAMPVAVVDKIENDYTFVGNDGPVLYFR